MTAITNLGLRNVKLYNNQVQQIMLGYNIVWPKASRFIAQLDTTYITADNQNFPSEAGPNNIVFDVLSNTRWLGVFLGDSAYILETENITSDSSSNTLSADIKHTLTDSKQRIAIKSTSNYSHSINIRNKSANYAKIVTTGSGLTRYFGDVAQGKLQVYFTNEAGPGTLSYTVSILGGSYSQPSGSTTITKTVSNRKNKTNSLTFTGLSGGDKTLRIRDNTNGVMYSLSGGSTLPKVNVSTNRATNRSSITFKIDETPGSGLGGAVKDIEVVGIKTQSLVDKIFENYRTEDNGRPASLSIVINQHPRTVANYGRPEFFIEEVNGIADRGSGFAVGDIIDVGLSNITASSFTYTYFKLDSSGGKNKQTAITISYKVRFSKAGSTSGDNGPVFKEPQVRVTQVNSIGGILAAEVYDQGLFKLIVASGSNLQTGQGIGAQIGLNLDVNTHDADWYLSPAGYVTENGDILPTQIFTIPSTNSTSTASELFGETILGKHLTDAISDSNASDLGMIDMVSFKNTKVLALSTISQTNLVHVQGKDFNNYQSLYGSSVPNSFFIRPEPRSLEDASFQTRGSNYYSDFIGELCQLDISAGQYAEDINRPTNGDGNGYAVVINNYSHGMQSTSSNPLKLRYTNRMRVGIGHYVIYCRLVKKGTGYPPNAMIPVYIKNNDYNINQLNHGYLSAGGNGPDSTTARAGCVLCMIHTNSKGETTHISQYVDPHSFKNSYKGTLVKDQKFDGKSFKSCGGDKITPRHHYARTPSPRTRAGEGLFVDGPMGATRIPHERVDGVQGVLYDALFYKASGTINYSGGVPKFDINISENQTPVYLDFYNTIPSMHYKLDFPFGECAPIHSTGYAYAKSYIEHQNHYSTDLELYYNLPRVHPFFQKQWDTIYSYKSNEGSGAGGKGGDFGPGPVDHCPMNWYGVGHYNFHGEDGTSSYYGTQNRSTLIKNYNHTYDSFYSYDSSGEGSIPSYLKRGQQYFHYYGQALNFIRQNSYDSRTYHSLVSWNKKPSIDSIFNTSRSNYGVLAPANNRFGLFPITNTDAPHYNISRTETIPYDITYNSTHSEQQNSPFDVYSIDEVYDHRIFFNTLVINQEYKDQTILGDRYGGMQRLSRGRYVPYETDGGVQDYILMNLLLPRPYNYSQSFLKADYRTTTYRLGTFEYGAGSPYSQQVAEHVYGRVLQGTLRTWISLGKVTPANGGRSILVRNVINTGEKFTTEKLTPGVTY